MTCITQVEDHAPCITTVDNIDFLRRSTTSTKEVAHPKRGANILDRISCRTMNSLRDPDDFTEPHPATSNSMMAAPPEDASLRILDISNPSENQLASDLAQGISPELGHTVTDQDLNDIDDSRSLPDASEPSYRIGRGQSKPSLVDRVKLQPSQLTRDSNVLETDKNKSYVNPKTHESTAQQQTNPAMAGGFGLGTEYQTNFTRIPHPLTGNMYPRNPALEIYSAMKHPFNSATNSEFENGSGQQLRFVQGPAARYSHSYDHNSRSTDVNTTSMVDLGSKGYHYASMKQIPIMKPDSLLQAANPPQRLYSNITYPQYRQYFESPQVYRSVYDVGNEIGSTKTVAVPNHASYTLSALSPDSRAMKSITEGLALEYSHERQSAQARPLDSAPTSRRQDSANRATQALVNPNIALTVNGPMDLSRLYSRSLLVPS